MFRVDVPAHDSKDMSIWGQLFRSLGKGNTAQAYANQRIAKITEYIDKMQVN